MNPWDVVVAAAIVALVAFAVWLMRRSRAKGGCACCPYAGECDDIPEQAFRYASNIDDVRERATKL